MMLAAIVTLLDGQALRTSAAHLTGERCQARRR